MRSFRNRVIEKKNWISRAVSIMVQLAALV
jgi:hypothetical protein